MKRESHWGSYGHRAVSKTGLRVFMNLNDTQSGVCARARGCGQEGLCNCAHHSRLARNSDLREAGLCGTCKGLGREPDACDVPGTSGQPA